ncbi:MAG TPA: hypothetical protein VFH02_12490 [Jiangellaceae bacterium]|nr:hypothetical protein [Jiangellaceae bacterium]
MFRLDFAEFGLSTFPVVFSREPEAGTMAVHFGVMPLSAHKRPESTNPRLWATGAVAVATTAIAVRRRRAVRTGS